MHAQGIKSLRYVVPPKIVVVSNTHFICSEEEMIPRDFYGV